MKHSQCIMKYKKKKLMRGFLVGPARAGRLADPGERRALTHRFRGGHPAEFFDERDDVAVRAAREAAEVFALDGERARLGPGVADRAWSAAVAQLDSE